MFYLSTTHRMLQTQKSYEKNEKKFYSGQKQNKIAGKIVNKYKNNQIA